MSTYAINFSWSPSLPIGFQLPYTQEPFMPCKIQMNIFDFMKWCMTIEENCM